MYCEIINFAISSNDFLEVVLNSYYAKYSTFPILSFIRTISLLICIYCGSLIEHFSSHFDIQIPSIIVRLIFKFLKISN